ncbi:MAG: efflux RND transporter periplasmic adaptor subunit [Planctomycetaceae bacterium]
MSDQLSVDSRTPPTSSPRRIHSLGRLEPRGTVLRISAPSGNEGARIERLLVEEGQDVEPGELLAVLDNAARREAAVEEAEARVQTAVAKLDQIRAGAKPGEIAAQAALVNRMEAELESARKELERARQLKNQKVLTAENFEQKELSFESARLECQRVRAQLDSLKEVRDVDLRLQEREVAAATASLNRARAELDAASVRSHAAGRVLKIHARPGERISDRGILQLGDVAHMQAVAEIFEADVHGLKVGQSATVRISSDGREIIGKIEQIGLMVARKDVLSNDPVSDTDARVLEVRVALPEQEISTVERLSNARVEVSIDLGAAEIPAAPGDSLSPGGGKSRHTLTTND